MGTTLTGLTPATTYDALIKVGDNGPLSATAKYVGDGLGNDSVVALSTSSVGIGTTSPTQLLHVAGNVRITGALYDGNNAAGTSGQILSSTGTGTDWVSKSDLSLVDGSGTANYVSKWSDTDTLTNSLIYDNGTNVGIGTSTFTNFVDRLRVVGDTNGVDLGGSSSTGVIRIRGAASTGASLIDFTDLSTDPNSSPFYQGRLFYSFSDNSLAVHTNSAERLRITSSGNVGIGTSSPVYKLQVSGASPAVSIDRTSGDQPKLAFNSVGTEYASIISNASSGENRFNIGPSGGWGGFHTFYTDTTEKVRIANNGNVGIGTSAPSQKLQVAGTGVTRITVENTDNQSTGAGLQMLVKNGGSTVGDGTIRTDNADNMQFFNIAGKIMELTSTGNLSLTTGNIALSAAGGIFFDSGASKYLDDYEVGTWTMGISFGGASVGVTYSNTTGTYTKIGRQVTVNGVVVLTSKGSSTGSVLVTGLPFLIGNNISYYPSVSVRLENVTFANQFQAYGGIGSAVISLNEITEAGVNGELTNTDFANNSTVMLSATYFV